MDVEDLKQEEKVTVTIYISKDKFRKIKEIFKKEKIKFSNFVGLSMNNYLKEKEEVVEN